MAITDLTNTTWVFNDVISVPPISALIDFTSNNTSYSLLYENRQRLDYDSTHVYYWDLNSWSNTAYKTIKITGGSSATSTDFIAWLEENAVQQLPITYYATSDEFTAVADAIRTVGSTSSTLIWPNGFVSAIDALGGGAPDFTACDIEITDNAGVLSSLDAVVACHYDSATNKVVAEKWSDADTDCYPEIDGDVYTWWDVVVPYHGAYPGAGAKVPWVLINNTALLSSCTVTSVTNGYAALCSLGLLVAPSSDGTTVYITLDEPIASSIDWRAIVNKTISGSISDSTITSIGCHAFFSCSLLTGVDFPNVTTIDYSAFFGCSGLTQISFPNLKTLTNAGGTFQRCTRLTSVYLPNLSSMAGIGVFSSCTNLQTVDLPKITGINANTFANCTKLSRVSLPLLSFAAVNAFGACASLTTISLPAMRSINANVFNGCTKLSSLYLMGSYLCTLVNSTAFNNTLIATTGKIYVPSSLYSSYRTATNWTYFASRFVSM